MYAKGIMCFDPALTAEIYYVPPLGAGTGLDT